jgi:2'-5' RNA ligase
VTAGPTTSRAVALGVAIAIPEPHGSELRDLRERFGDPQARSIPAHVTLLPPTTVDDVLLPEIEQHLDAVARVASAFDVRLSGSGSFRPISPVVFVNLAEGTAGCERLENGVRSGVLARPVHFAYHPHVTVAHDLPDTVLDAAAAELSGYTASFKVDQFTLYQHDDGVWVPRRDFLLGGVSGG